MIVDGGGLQFRTEEERVIYEGRGFNPNRWMYTGTSVSTAISGPDYRQTSPGILNIAFLDTSTTNNLTYGAIRLEFDVSFRAPIPYANPLG